MPVLVFGGAPRPRLQRRPQRADRQPGQVVLRRVLLRLGQRRVVQGVGQGLLPEIEPLPSAYNLLLFVFLN